MLFKAIHLQGIKSGRISLAFRKWQKASVRSGTLLHTAVGLIEIQQIEAISESDLSEKDALDAGFRDQDDLLKSFRQKDSGTIFKIAVAYHSADPRIELREQTELSGPQLCTLRSKLERLDRLSKHGSWTEPFLVAIKNNPFLHAAGLSTLTGLEKEWLKLNIRKLKNLGLTISHQKGYEVSPLGELYLQMGLNVNVIG